MDENEKVMGQPLPAAGKWGPPALVSAIPRRRLFERLDQLAEHPCTWIQAPGGYGKTYLLYSYLKQPDRHSLWYNLDEGDSDVGAFFADFGTAAESAGLRHLAHFSAEVQAIGRFSRLYFHQIAAAVGVPTVLVLDDYHRIASDCRLHEAIADALEHLPPSLRLVVLSREAPPPPFARAISHLKVGLIDAESLSLTDDEALEIARHIPHKHLSDEAVAAARRQVAGWTAGFVLLVRQPDPTELAPSSSATLAKYFEHEVLRPAPESIRELLWQTAIFPCMTAPMVERLTGRGDASALLTGLAGANYFLYARQQPEAAYHYHDLFRDFLLEYGRREYPARWADTARRAAEILAEVGAPKPAAEIYASLADWDLLSRLISRYGPQLLQQGSYRTLNHWLSILPEVLRKDDPWMLYWTGCAQLATSPRSARESLQRAFSILASSGEVSGALLVWAATCQAFFLAFDDLRPLGEWLNKLYALAPPETTLPDDLEARIAPGVFLCLMVERPAAPELGHWEGVLLRLLEEKGDPNLSAMAATLLVLHFTYTMGDRARSLRLREALRALRGSERMAPVSIVLLGGFAELVFEYSFGGSTSHTLEILRQAGELTEAQGIRLYDASRHAAFAYCHLVAGDQHQAREALDRMAKMMDWERKWDVGFYYEMRAWDAWLSGRVAEAWEFARQTIALKENFGMMHTRPVAHIAAVQTANSLGQRAEALRHLAAIRQWTRATGSHIGAFMRGMMLAHLAFERGQRRRAHKVLRVSFALGQVEGYVNAHFFRREDLAALCAEALDADIAPEYVVRIIRSRQLPPPTKIEHAERWPWPLRVYALGGFRFEVDGTTQTADPKGQQKPIELLKALVAAGGEAVPQDRLADMLWPDADGDMAGHSLKTTLSRLRKLLGRNDFVLLQDGRLSLNRAICWVDAWRFDELADVIGQAGHVGVQTRSLDEIEALVIRLRNAYPGPLLHDGLGGWAEPYRRRIHLRYERCVRQLAQLMEGNGARQAASALVASAVLLESPVAES
jgi:LuxR family maltose regulon positive regulatory protein